MARWEGNARGRLEQAALELFEEQGYDRTTVAQITRRANLTERSFYRWFTDKREVLFGDDELESEFLTAIDAVPTDTPALVTLLQAFATAPKVFRPRPFLLRRAEVIAANPPLRERELIKLVSLSEALVEALLRRGVEQETAQLATDLGLAVLRLASRRWMAAEHPDPATFADALSTAATDLLAVAAAHQPR